MKAPNRQRLGAILSAFVLFTGSHTAADMPLLLIHIQYLPHLLIEHTVLLRQALLKILVYGGFGYAEMLGRRAHSGAGLNHVHSQLSGAFLNGVCHTLSSDAVCCQDNSMCDMGRICVLDTYPERG